MLAACSADQLRAYEGTIRRIGPIRSELQVRAGKGRRKGDDGSGDDSGQSGGRRFQIVEVLLAINPAAARNTLAHRSSLSDVPQVKVEARPMSVQRAQAKRTVQARVTDDRAIKCVLRDDLIGSVAATDRVLVIGTAEQDDDCEEERPQRKAAGKAKDGPKDDDDAAAVQEVSDRLSVHSIQLFDRALPNTQPRCVVDAIGALIPRGRDSSICAALLERPLSLALPELPRAVGAGLLLSMVSAVHHAGADDGGAGVHVLLVCNPSEPQRHHPILAPLALLHPHTVYVSACQPAPLWSSVAYDSDYAGKETRSGALMQANGGLCLIDDLDPHVASPAAAQRFMGFLSRTRDLVVGQCAGRGASSEEMRSSATVIATTRCVGSEYDVSRTLAENVRLSTDVLAAFGLVLIVSLPDLDTDHVVRGIFRAQEHWQSLDSSAASRDSNDGPAPLLNPQQLTTLIALRQNAREEPVLPPDAALRTRLRELYGSLRALSLQCSHLPRPLAVGPRHFVALLKLSQAVALLDGQPAIDDCCIDEAQALLRYSLHDQCHGWDGQPIDLSKALQQHEVSRTLAAAGSRSGSVSNKVLDLVWGLLKAGGPRIVTAQDIAEVALLPQCHVAGLAGDKDEVSMLIEGLSSKHAGHFLRQQDGWQINV